MNNKLVKNKRILSILIIIAGFILIFLPKHYSLLAIFVLYYGFRMNNKAFLNRFSEKDYHFVYRSDSRIRKIKLIFALPVILGFIFLVISNPEPIYKSIVLVILIPFMLLYNLVDRYKMVSATGDLAKTATFFERKLKLSKRLMIGGFLVGFIPVINFLGLILIIIGIVQYLTIKVLYSNSNKFVYVQPAYVHSKNDIKT